MASQHITIANQTNQTSKITSLIETMWSIDNQLVRLKAVVDQVAQGGDFDSLAKEFGFASAADAQTFYNLLIGVVGDWTGATTKGNIPQLMQRMG